LVQHVVLPNFIAFGYLALLATAAGRAGGLDAVLRPAWRRSTGRVARLAVIAS
jgi:hypothetical protein